MWSSFRQRIDSALRYKLLALVLFPLLAAMGVTLGYTLYWFHGYTQESLKVTLRDHLAGGRQALRQLQNDHQLALQQLAESEHMRTLLKARNGPAIRRTLQRLRAANGLAFLHLTGVAGNWLYEEAGENTSKPSPLTDRAARGFSGAAFEVFREEELRRESAILADQARIAWRAGDGQEERALILRLVQPIPDEQGRVSMMLDAGLLLNRNHLPLYTLSDRIFGAASSHPDTGPIVALLLHDTRLAAAGAGWNGLIGTRVKIPAPPPSERQTDHAILREKLLGVDAHVSAYGGLYDVNGQHVGFLQVGLREQPFAVGYYRAAGFLLSLFLVATAVAAWIAIRGVRAIFKPIERMAAVVRATQAGEDRRIGPIGARDEIGELARQFDNMLDQLAARNREIQRAASALEAKVAERTHELAQKNKELQTAVELIEKTKEQLVMADKLSALGRMAAGIAHEINNPAAVILGNLDVLTSELGPAAKPVAREIELIAEQVERIRHIVNSLLQFARARPGTGQLVEVSVNRLVQDVFPLVAHSLNAKAITLHHRLEAHGTVTINVFDLEQVLINLIVNAANACDRGGIIQVTTADWDGHGAMISVCDNGCGIAQEGLKRIFDPFFTTDPQRGAGLGLSVSYGLVRRYGGHITVESAVGVGSVFRVWLLQRPEVAIDDSMRLTGMNQEVSYG